MNENALEERLVAALQLRQKSLATAESCTGGLVSARVTSVPGASMVFPCGICCYVDEIKHKLLGVRPETLERFTAVSRQCAAEMARGVRALAGASIGVSVTGYAGPGGGTPEAPVGTVFLGVDSAGLCEVRELHLPGERAEICRAAAEEALQLALAAALAPG